MVGWVSNGPNKKLELKKHLGVQLHIPAVLENIGDVQMFGILGSKPCNCVITMFSGL